LFFLGVATTAYGSVVASPIVWTSALVLIAVATRNVRHGARPGVAPLSVAVAAYVVWLIVNDFVNAPYTAAGVFHPAFLASGFVLGRTLEPPARKAAARAVVVGMTLLAFWALWQSASGEGRAHAHFETPNTLATVLNLALAPVLLRIAYGDERRSMLGIAGLLSAALVCTLSRGGFIALAVGLAAVALLSRRRPAPSGMVRMLSAVAVGAMVGVLALQWPTWIGHASLAPEGLLQGIASTFAGTLAARTELYRLALSAVPDHPLFGVGYLGFNALFEAGRALVPAYGFDNLTYFVHNDYLQTLVELGLPGFVLLVAIVVLPFWLARGSSRSVKDRLSLHAALAGIATMAIHAVADFPFYVPICLLLFGALLGEADRLIAGEELAVRPMLSARARLARIAGAAVLMLIVLPPPLAEATAAFGERSWRSGDAGNAAFAFELARRLQARDWRYHWYAAQFWYAQATLTSKREHADLADRAFAAAMDANARDPRPLLGRLATQLRFAGVLGDRQSPQTLRGWADRALALAPLNPSVRKDHAAALAQLGSEQ
jgi:O-antigen ligase